MNDVQINALLNPVTRKIVHSRIPAKGRLSDHLVTPEGTVIYRNGRGYRDGELFPGDVIDIIAAPQGGEQGKSIARTSAILAVQLGATALAGPLGLTTASGALSLGGRLFVGAASVGAMIGINALIPPAGATQGDETEFNKLGVLTGSRNRVLPYGVVPRVYGHHRIFPPMTARPFTEIAGNRQYQYLLFNLGNGPLELSKPMIGDTEIGSFDTDNNFTSNGVFEDIEIDVAENPSLYTSQVQQSNPSVSLNEAEDEEPVAQAERTTSDDAEQISIDLIFPQGLFSVNDGKTESARVLFTIEYKEVGAGSWTALERGDQKNQTGFAFFLGSVTSPEFWPVQSSKKETHFASVTWAVPKGQYDVRITRSETVVGENDQRFTDCTWMALRSATFEEPTNLPGTVQLAMRIQATDQLSGVLDNFSVEAKSRLAFYDGSDWDEPTFNAATGNGTGGKITSSPAWIVADILSGSANARAIGKARLDEDSLKDWADNCETEERECNIILDSRRTVLQTVSLVGSTGRGSLSLRDNGIYTIIQDTEQSTPVQHFTPRNSWGFSSTRTFPDVPHAIRVNFTNPDKDWQTDEATVYADGYDADNATLFETLDLQGVTSWNQAWKEGRYRLAEAILRPERYVMNVDVENLVCTRGSMVRVSHDVTLHGLKSGRIKSISGNTLTLDESVPMESGKSYNIRVRASDGSSITESVTTDVGNQTEITVNSSTGIQKGDLFMFGEAGTETQEMKVLSIEPMGDLSARLTLIDAAPEIYDADTGEIPPFNSNVTRPPVDLDRLTPPVPSITSIRSEGDSLVPGPSGIPNLRISVSYVIGSGNPTAYVEGRYRKRNDESGWTSFGISEASSGVLTLFDVEADQVYIIQIRASSGELKSAWVQGNPHTAGEGIVVPGRPENAIGSITQDLDGEYTEIPVNLTSPARTGIDYWIVREGISIQLFPMTPNDPTWDGEDITDRIPEYGPGLLEELPVEQTIIRAPAGSYIIEQPGQAEIDRNINEEIQREINEVKIPALDANLDNLNDVVLPELESQLDELNDVQLPALQSAINDLNNIQLPALDDRLGTLETTLAGVSFPIGSTNISDGAILTPKLAANAVIASKIDVSEIAADTGFMNTFIANSVFADEFIGNTALLESIAADTGFFNELTSNSFWTADLAALNGFVNTLVSNEFFTDELTTNTAFVNSLKGNEAFIGNVTIGNNLSTLEGSGAGVLIGNALDGSLPYVRAQRDNNNYVQMVANTGSNHFFRAVAGGDTIFELTSAGATFGNVTVNNQINVQETLLFSGDGVGTNSNNDFTINEDGFTIGIGAGLFFPPTGRVYRINDGNGDFWGGLWGDDSVGGGIVLRSEDNLYLRVANVLILGASNFIDCLSPVRLESFTTTGMNNISSPETGFMIYNATVDRPAFYTGSEWRQLQSSSF